MPEAIIQDDKLLRLVGSDKHIYAQLTKDGDLTHYKFLNKNDEYAAFVDLENDLSCTNDPPQSDNGYLYALYWGSDGKKDLFRRKGEMEVTQLNCQHNIVHFSVSGDHIIVVDPDGYMYTKYKDESWIGNIDSSNHTNSRVAAYHGTYYQSCSIDYWGSIHMYQGNNNWKKIDGNNKNRDLVAGPDWLLTRYPSGKTWKWNKPQESWTALSGDENSNVTLLVASQVSNPDIYRLFKDGSIWNYSEKKETWWHCYSSAKHTHISVDRDNLYRVTDDHKGYVDEHF